MIFYRDDFVDEYTLEELHRLYNFIDLEDYWYDTGQGRVFHISKVFTEWKNKKYYSLLIDVLKEIKKEIETSFDIEAPVYADSYMFVKWIEGKQQYPHADSHHNTGRPNNTPWRKFSTVLYLNDEFDGGETYFPDHDLSIEPKKGRLALFSSGLDYKHGVNRVENGVRKNLIAFWGYDREMCRQYRI